jgi:hypothetical protein
MARISRKPAEQLANKEISIELDTSYSQFQRPGNIGVINEVQEDGKWAEIELRDSFEVNGAQVKCIRVIPRYEHESIYRLNSRIPWRRKLIVNVLSMTAEVEPAFFAIGRISMR